MNLNGSSILNCKGGIVPLHKTFIMGILNMTPDSFYQESRKNNVEQGLEKATQFIQEGADIIDVGGYSSRSGAVNISIEEEINRVVPVIEKISLAHPKTLISIDTFRSEVAEAAIHAGASIINDISGGTIDPKIFHTAAQYNCPYILMHMRGTPKNMQTLTAYDHLIKDVLFELSSQIQIARKAGVKDIIVDPGIGFAKTLDQNYEILSNLKYFNELNLPILIGISRKSLIYKHLKNTPQEAINGTTVLNTVAIYQKASILRVHDIKEAKEVIQLMEKIS